MITILLNNKIFAYVLILSCLTVGFYLISVYQMSFLFRETNPVKDQFRAFECGFEPFCKKYLGFCVQFIKTALLFLLVDLEIALLMPFFVNTGL